MKMKHAGELKIFICLALICKSLVGEELLDTESHKDETNNLDEVDQNNIENLKDVRMSVDVQVVTFTKVLVNWTLGLGHHQYRQPHLEIIYSPVVASYYVVHPIVNPASEFVILENLQPRTNYQLMMRTANKTNFYLQTDIVYFSTSVSSTVPAGGQFLDPTATVTIDLKHEELFLVIFILFLWAVVLRLFFQRWGKIRGLLPYQPVYSKEMADKIEKIENEKIEKIARSNRTSFSFQPVDCFCSYKDGIYPRLDKTSSTLLIKQPNSLDVDTQDLRKTKSAENIQCCPKIIIDQTYSRPTGNNHRKSPISYNFLSIPRDSNLMEIHEEEKSYPWLMHSNVTKKNSFIRRNSSVAKDEMWFSREKKLIKQDKAIDDFDDK